MLVFLDFVALVGGKVTFARGLFYPSPFPFYQTVLVKVCVIFVNLFANNIYGVDHCLRLGLGDSMACVG